MHTYFLKSEDFLKFHECIAKEFALYAPVKIKSTSRLKCDYGFDLPADDYILRRYIDIEKTKEEIVFNEYRCVEPTRALFTYAKEEISTYFNDAASTQGVGGDCVAVCGVKNCDLFSLKVQDYVFLGGNEADPFYKARRENTLIISGDCPNFKESCFCRAFDINPYAAEGFDLNLSPVRDGYLVDVATERPKKVIKTADDILYSATAEQLSERASKRESVIKEMEKHLSQHKIPKKDALKDIVLSGYNSKVFQEQALTCVECGGCVFMCDTCHCFLLADESTNSTPEVKKVKELGKRTRIWDGCLYRDFARVAGGANPLKMRYMRLRNRYLKKFDFFIDNMGVQACCGCGRCIDVCPGKIDIRYILRKLYEEKHLSAR